MAGLTKTQLELQHDSGPVSDGSGNGRAPAGAVARQAQPT